MVRKNVVKILHNLLLQKGIDVSKIIIFGSYAKNKTTPDSDIDFIVISKDLQGKDIFERVKLTCGVHRALVKKIKKPADIMYYSEKEWKNRNSLVVNAAREEGIIYNWK